MQSQIKITIKRIIIIRNITELIKKETASSNITYGAQLNIELR